MFLDPRIRNPWRSRISAVLPWVFVIGVAAGALLPARDWLHRRDSVDGRDAAIHSDSEAIWRRAGNPSVRHPVEVLRTVDGDTFEGRVHLWPGLDMTTRVRLRGIDAPERKASCAEESRLAETATTTLRALLSEGGVAIYNIGPDKYAGRVVADVATTKTANVSTALISAGQARAYSGGRRVGWCAGARW